MLKEGADLRLICIVTHAIGAMIFWFLKTGYHMTLRLGVKQRHAIKSVNH